MFDGVTWYILTTLAIGFAVGTIAKFLKPGRDEPQSFLLTIALGIVGAFFASFVGQFVGFYRPGEHAGFFGSVIGAVALLVIYGWFRKTPRQNP